jgi:hypothetical protein
VVFRFSDQIMRLQRADLVTSARRVQQQSGSWA